MLFTSIAFAIFFSLVFIIYWAVPHKFRWPLLLAVSCYFYVSWNPKYVLLILFTTAVSYAAGLILDGCESPQKKRITLAAALISCLGVLVFFKYFNFISESISSFLGLFAIKINPIIVKVTLPVGISFYTFQILSYVIDVYRGNIKAERNFGIYAACISYFPKLVAGPIERAGNLIPQLKSEKHFEYDKAAYGLKLMAWGYFKKIAIADILAVYVDKVYDGIGSMHGLDYALAILFFTIQIYCDFSGYSDIAIGASKLFGIDLMTNFKSPYFSKSVKEFWSRWHISLSTWFRDYVYIPLGGSRCSPAKNYRNLLITFAVSGLWHGANWTFVIWGAMHGVLQILEKMFDSVLKKFRNRNRITGICSTLAVFIFCNLAWVFFRADKLSDAAYVIHHALIDLRDPGTYFAAACGLTKSALLKIFVTLVILGLFDYFSLKTDVIEWVGRQKVLVQWMIYIGLVFLILIYAPVHNETQFIYAQF